MAEAILPNLLSGGNSAVEYLGIFSVTSTSTSFTLPKPHEQVLCICPLTASSGLVVTQSTNAYVIPISEIKTYAVNGIIEYYDTFQNAKFKMFIGHPTADTMTATLAEVSVIPNTLVGSRQYNILIFGIS